MRGRMRWQDLLSATVLLSNAASVFGQSTTSSNPLNDFIGGVNSAVNIIQSASASAAAAAATRSSSTSSSPTAASSSSPSTSQSSPTTSPSPTATPAHHGSSNKTLIIAVVCAVVGAILLALILLGICCCLTRRRRKARKDRGPVPVADDEKDTWKSEKPQNPGRTYIPSQYGRVPSAEHEPMIPPQAAGSRDQTPILATHPAYRPENPFVPVPPSPRRSAPNSRNGLTEGTVSSDVPYAAAGALPAKQRHRSHSRSGSDSRPTTATSPDNNGLPTHANADRPSTPFGLSGIGQPYEDMHVHVLQNDAPSQALQQQSLNNRDPLLSGRSPTPGWSTPPDVPNRSPRRSGQFTDSPYTTGTSSTASEEYRASYAPAITIPHDTSPYSHRLNYESQFEPQKPQQQQYPPQQPYFSVAKTRSSHPPTMMQPPPVPWSEPSEQRRQSPTRNPAQYAESGRRASRSPATSINGQPRRLRFSDLQASPNNPGGWDSRYGHSSYAHGGVGEAM